jgi:hypothetical protein
MYKKTLIATATLLALASGAASAGTITHTVEADRAATDFNDQALTFEKFDTLGGTRELTSISFSLFGEVDGTAKVENLSDTSGAEITALTSALLTLESYNGHELVTALPSVLNEFSATSFDGVVDWAGTSGKTFDNVYSNATEANYIVDEVILDMFTGSGSIDTFLSANANTQATGGGNIFSGFETFADGAVTITYHHQAVTPPSETNASVPVSSTFLLLGASMLGLASRRKLKVKA